MRDSFVFYRSFSIQLRKLNPEQFKKVMEAIFDYALDGIEFEESNSVESIIFGLIKPQLEANNKRYENGCRGGRPKQNGETKQKPNHNQTITKVKPNENDNENVNDKSQKKEEIKKKKGNAQTLFFKEFPSVVFDNYDRNVLAELSEDDWLTIIEQFKKSEWLRKNVKTVSTLCRLSTRILAGQYAPFEKTDGDGITDKERAENIRRFEEMFGADAGY